MDNPNTKDSTLAWFALKLRTSLEESGGKTCDIDADLLARFMDDECSAAEKRAVMHALVQDQDLYESWLSAIEARVEHESLEAEGTVSISSERDFSKLLNQILQSVRKGFENVVGQIKEHIALSTGAGALAAGILAVAIGFNTSRLSPNEELGVYTTTPAFKEQIEALRGVPATKSIQPLGSYPDWKQQVFIGAYLTLNSTPEGQSAIRRLYSNHPLSTAENEVIADESLAILGGWAALTEIFCREDGTGAQRDFRSLLELSKQMPVEGLSKVPSNHSFPSLTQENMSAQADKVCGIAADLMSK